MSDPGTVRYWNGTRYQTILSTAETGGAMSIIYGEAEPFNGPPTHVHYNEDEVFIVLEGEVAFDLAGQRFTRGPMGTAFVPRGKPHSFMTGSNGARCLTVLTPGGFEGFFAELARGGFELPQDLASVAAIAASYGSHFVGPGIAQLQVQHA
jgi:mannose-6-phosphate isomerase-like protein (cupin superfamily)